MRKIAMSSYLKALLEPYPDLMTIAEIRGLIGGTDREIEGYLKSGEMTGLQADGRWSVSKGEVSKFISAHLHLAGAA